MKSALGEALTASYVWTGRKVASSGTTPGTTTPTPATAAPLSCTSGLSDGKFYTSSSGSTFVIECGSEYAGYDLHSEVTASFEDCIDGCSELAGCVDVCEYTHPSFTFYLEFVQNLIIFNSLRLRFLLHEERPWRLLDCLIRVDWSPDGGHSNFSLMIMSFQNKSASINKFDSSLSGFGIFNAS